MMQYPPMDFMRYQNADTEKKQLAIESKTSKLTRKKRCPYYNHSLNSIVFYYFIFPVEHRRASS
ncbi:unnamed protein product [Trichobilharzia regenti]|nr:unnamed protein product [Trichobilharzia regenti]